MLGTPKATHLFHKAIIQSGYTLADMTLAQALDKGKALAAHFGLKNATAEQLRTIPANAFWPLSGPLKINPVPVSGDAVLPQPMLEVFFTARHHPMPILIGSDSDEASVLAIFNVNPALEVQKHRLGLRLIKLLYPGVKGDEASGRLVCRDMAFTTLGYVLMKAHQQVSKPCWRYWFDYVAESEHQMYPHGTAHSNEVAYVFDTLLLAESDRNGVKKCDLAFSAQIADYWVNFARHASRRCTVLNGSVQRPACVNEQDRLLRIGLNKHAGFRGISRFMRARLALFCRVMHQHVSLD